MLRNPPTKTIAHARAAGETRFAIHCENTAVYCYHKAEMTFDEIGLPDSMIFVEIPQVKGFRAPAAGAAACG